MTLEEIREIDQKLTLDILQNSLFKLANFISKSPIPNTLKALKNIMLNTSMIKEGIYNLLKTDDIYSCEILYRAIIEHYFLHTFLFFQYCEDKTDRIGKEYLEIADLQEEFYYGRAVNKKSILMDEGDMQDELIKAILNKFPKYKDISRKKLNEIVRRYSFKNITKELYNKFKKDKPSDLLDLIPDYTILSSFVHGGPHSIRLMKIFSRNSEEKEEERLKLYKQAYHFTTWIKLNTYIVAGQYDSYFLKYTNILRKYAVKVFI